MTWLRATFWLVWEPVRIKSSTHWTRNWHRLFYAHAISCTVIASDKWSGGCSLIQLNSYKNTPILTLITMTAWRKKNGKTRKDWVVSLCTWNGDACRHTRKPCIMCFWADFFLAGYNSTQDRDLEHKSSPKQTKFTFTRFSTNTWLQQY